MKEKQIYCWIIMMFLGLIPIILTLILADILIREKILLFGYGVIAIVCEVFWIGNLCDHKKKLKVEKKYPMLQFEWVSPTLLVLCRQIEQQADDIVCKVNGEKIIIFYNDYDFEPQKLNCFEDKGNQWIFCFQNNRIVTINK